MLSDVLIPLFDPLQDGQVGAYETALERLERAVAQVDVAVPGHGSVAEGPEVAARLAADRAYIEALRLGQESVDARLEADWIAGIHGSNQAQARGREPAHPDGRLPGSSRTSTCAPGPVQAVFDPPFAAGSASQITPLRPGACSPRPTTIPESSLTYSRLRTLHRFSPSPCE